MSKYRNSRVVFALVVAAGGASISLLAAGAGTPQARPATVPAAAATSAAPDVQAFAKQFCIGCHNDRNKNAVRGFSLEGVDPATAGQHGEVWEKVVAKLRAGQMPPLTARRPDRALSDQVATWLEGELDKNAVQHPNPGRTDSLHRLNRTEYKNSVRDLLGLEIDVESLLPPDPLGGGDANFDNIASSLRMSRSLLERYVSTARRVSRTAMSGKPPVSTQVFKAPDGLRQDSRLDGMPFGTRGGLAVNYVFPADGVYKFDLRVGRSLGGDGFGGQGLPGEVIELSIDGEQVKQWEVVSRGGRGSMAAAAPGAPAVAPTYDIQIPVKAGQHRVIATFAKTKPKVEQEGDRLPLAGQQLPGNVMPPGLSSLALIGPLEVLGKGDTPSRRRILTCTPRTVADEERCARQILTTLARRGYRRPSTEEDLTFLMRFFKEGRADSDFDSGIERAIRALLVSPDYLYRTETDPAGVAPGVPYQVNNLELASRLSFFVWSSIPDDELLDLAIKGQLTSPPVLQKQVRRMLQDQRSEAFTKSFASFYLWIRNVTDTQMDSELFPNFDLMLRQAMAKETELFFDSVRAEDRGILTLLDADYTFVNERLAQHYGIPGVIGSDFRRVQLPPNSPRRGILGKASVLTVTSVPTRTSPVKRGKWLLDNVLGAPPPAPPANIPPLGEQRQDDGRILTVRELMAKHRANPVCAGCHNTIDPVGFALEQFDATGKYREVDRSFARIDPAGTMPDGGKFSSLAEFRKLIVGNPAPFLRTFTEKMLVYALGRPFEPYDAPAVRKVLAGAAASNYKFSDIVMGIVQSAPFRMRRPDATTQLSAAAQ